MRINKDQQESIALQRDECTLISNNCSVGEKTSLIQIAILRLTIGKPRADRKNQ